MNLLATRGGRRLLFTALYLSEGAPIGFVWWAVPTLLKGAGVPVSRTTLIVSSLTLLWAMKFLWAPLVDALRTARWGFKHWIASAQVGMGVALLPFFWISPVGHLVLVAALLMLHALFASTQDVAIDALCISSVPSEERGSINGWMQVGMLVGRAAFGGGMLLLIDQFGRPLAFGLLIFSIWSTMSLLLFVREPEFTAPTLHSRDSSFRQFAATLRETLSHRRIWLGLGFAATGGAAYEALGILAGPLMLDLGLPQRQIGLFFAIPAVINMAAGALVGGKLADLLGRGRAVVLCLLLLVSFIGVTGLLLHLGALDSRSFPVALGCVYVLIGSFTATTYALFMDLTHPRLAATQFSAFMAATNLCEFWAGSISGTLAEEYTYGWTLIGFAFVSAASILWLIALKSASPGESINPSSPR